MMKAYLCENSPEPSFAHPLLYNRRVAAKLLDHVACMRRINNAVLISPTIERIVAADPAGQISVETIFSKTLGFLKERYHPILDTMADLQQVLGFIELDNFDIVDLSSYLTQELFSIGGQIVTVCSGSKGTSLSYGQVVLTSYDLDYDIPSLAQQRTKTFISNSKVSISNPSLREGHERLKISMGELSDTNKAVMQQNVAEGLEMLQDARRHHPVRTVWVEGGEHPGNEDWS